MWMNSAKTSGKNTHNSRITHSTYPHSHNKPLQYVNKQAVVHNLCAAFLPFSTLTFHTYKTTFTETTRQFSAISTGLITTTTIYIK